MSFRSRATRDQRPKSEIKHSTSKRATLSKHSKKTLGAGNLISAVQLPVNEDRREWLAANTVDFFNEISLLYALVADDAVRFTAKGSGFPPGYEYLWKDDDAPKSTKAERCSSPDYVDKVMLWVEECINDESIFPVADNAQFPKNFDSIVRKIFKRLFRVFAIIYHRHFEVIERLEATRHLNTCCKHFVFFCIEFDLVDPKEMKALEGPVTRLTSEYMASRKEMAS